MDMKKKRKDKAFKIASCYSGNAALCAILIMIMLLAIGSAALVVTGRTQIHENQSMPEKTIAVEESSLAADPEAVPDEETEPAPLMVYPEKDFDFMKMELPDVTAKYSVLLDVSNNKIYTARNYLKKAYPASLTKLMTVIVAIENTDNLKDTYKFTKQDIKSLQDENASVAGFKAGEKVTVEDLLYGAMLPSGADATLGLANYVAGSEEEFVKLMNDKCEELGLTGTHFTNASGLHDKDHYSTAMDIAMICKYGLETEGIKDEFIKVISAKDHTTRKNAKHEEGILLDSIFFGRYEGFFIDRDEDGQADANIVGGKTGFTDESGYSLASIYEVDGEYFVCVTIKSGDSGKATMDNVAIAERYLPTYDLIRPENESSSSADSTTDSGVVDATPTPIDQTDSNGGADSSSAADDTSTDTSTAENAG